MKKTMFRKIAALSLVLLMFTTSFTNVFANQASTTDVTQLEANLGKAITRGEFAMLVNSTLNLTKTADANFSDVKGDSPYANDLLIAKATGYFVGDEYGNINPDALLSGADASVIINKLLGFNPSQAPLLNNLAINNYAKPSASTLIDLTMLNKEQIAKESLSVKDAKDFLKSLQVAQLFSDSPYALKQTTPADDFYVYENRQYLATAVPKTGSLAAMPVFDIDLTNKQINEIFTEIINSKDLAVGSDEWNINELYKMYMDNDTRTKSISKLKPYFDEINAVSSIEELRALAKKRSNLFDYQMFYSLAITSDAKVDAKKYAVEVAPKQPPLGSKDYYADSEKLLPIQNAYKESLSKLLEYIGETEDVTSRGNAIYDLVKGATVKLMPAEMANNPKVKYTNGNWDEMLDITKNSGTLTNSDALYNEIKDLNLYVPNIEYIKYVESLYTEENLQTLKDIALLRVVSSFSDYLGDDFHDISNGLIKAIYGMVPEKQPIEKRAQAFVASYMQNAITNIYVKKYCSKSVKDDVTEMVELIRDKYRERISALTWMSDATKKNALEKLEAIKVEVAFPDETLKTFNFKIVAKDDGGNLIDTAINNMDEQIDKSLKELKKPFEPNVWEAFSPTTLNAFYAPSLNKIIICNGILLEPYYSEKASREENLAAIGAIIAHEFTHAFDNNGAQYDKNGTLVNWWTSEDYKAFNQLTDKMAKEINNYKFIEGVPLNGLLTQGEAIADLGGFSCVLDIIDDNPNSDVQKAMTAWARVWAARLPLKVAEADMTTNVHLPHKVRANFTLSQLDEFYKIFNVTQKDGMYIPSENRVKIW